MLTLKLEPGVQILAFTLPWAMWAFLSSSDSSSVELALRQNSDLKGLWEYLQVSYIEHLEHGMVCRSSVFTIIIIIHYYKRQQRHVLEKLKLFLLFLNYSFIVIALAPSIEICEENTWLWRKKERNQCGTSHMGPLSILNSSWKLLMSFWRTPTSDLQTLTSVSKETQEWKNRVWRLIFLLFSEKSDCWQRVSADLCAQKLPWNNMTKGKQKEWSRSLAGGPSTAHG